MNELNKKLIELQLAVERTVYEKEILENEYDELMKQLKRYERIESNIYQIIIIIISIFIGIVLCCFVK